MLFDRPSKDQSDKKEAILSELHDPSLKSGTKFSGSAEGDHIEKAEV